MDVNEATSSSAVVNVNQIASDEKDYSNIAVPLPMMDTEFSENQKENFDGVDESTSNSPDELKSEFVKTRMHELVVALSARTKRVKENIMRPPSPVVPDTPVHVRNKEGKSMKETNEDEITINGDDEIIVRSRINSLFAKTVPFDLNSGMSTPISWSGPLTKKIDKCKIWLSKPVNPQGILYMSWQFVVMMCYFYNCWGILLRVIFPYQTPSNCSLWLIADYCADIIYILDILIKLRVKMLVAGLWVTDPAVIPKCYLRSRTFRFDALSLLPLDLFYFQFGVKPILRLPRFLKIQVFWDFFNKCDRIAKSPYIVRIIRIFVYMLYLIHLNACAYYAFSYYKGIGSNKWVYNGVGNAYIRCFLFALKTATSIGKNPKPIEEDEFFFMTCMWLIGVFIFAILIGQIRDTLSTASKPKQNYQKSLDRIHTYMQRLNIPDNLQKRVSEWFDYNWQENKGEDVVLNSLPKKMKSDLALYIHFETLKKVQLFRGLETELLRELVLKLKPVLYLPGDYICRKGEVGTEMYIINSGKVEVMGGVNDDVVMVTLGGGSVFGEVSLLALAGGNRRTADVRSKGYSNIFVLNKRCLQETVKEYPDAQEVLKHKARKLMKAEEKKVDEQKNEEDVKSVVIRNPNQSPQLAHTVLQILATQMLNEKNKSLVTNLESDVDKKEQLRPRNILLVEPMNYYYDKPENGVISDDSVSIDSLSSSSLTLLSCSTDEDRSTDEKRILSAKKLTKRSKKRKLTKKIDPDLPLKAYENIEETPKLFSPFYH